MIAWCLSSVFRDKISCYERENEKGAPLLKRRYSTAIGSSDVKMVADRHRHAVYHNKQWQRAS